MITLEHIRKVYHSENAAAFEALHDISEEIRENEMVAVVGTSGAGKSSLLKIIACIEAYQDGEYYLDDTLVKGLSEKEYAKIRNEKIGYVMQDFGLVEEFTALENVMMPLILSRNKVQNKKKLALEALQQVGMEAYAGKRCKYLSGGQKQRIAIARALVHHPKVILADEPTGSLDSHTSMEIMRLFRVLHEQGKTILIVTHDANIAAQCERIIRIEDGTLCK